MASRLAIAIAAALLCACGSSAANPGAGGASTAAPSSSTAAPSSSSTAAPSSSSSSTATSVPTGPSTGAPPCGPAGAHTLAASRRARVYSVGGRVIGCAAGSSRRWVLGVSGSCIGRSLVNPAAVTGTLAAYATELCGIDTGTTQVVIRRLTDGKVLSQVRATTTSLGPESHVRVTALVLSRNGDAAWISAGGSIVGNRSLVEVHALERGGVRRLDGGGAINRTVLQLNGSRLRWKHSGRWQTAKLS